MKLKKKLEGLKGWAKDNAPELFTAAVTVGALTVYAVWAYKSAKVHGPCIDLSEGALTALLSGDYVVFNVENDVLLHTVIAALPAPGA